MRTIPSAQFAPRFAIRDSLVEEGRLDVRIGITTGEVLVALGARPSEGEGMASGDVVNTAARLQSAAPTNGIIVDEATYRFTRGVIDYREEAHVDAKGKSQPVRVWEVVAARARLGVEPAARESVDLVGRREELRLLVDHPSRGFARAREPQVVTVTGVPGIGKSRLVYELFKTVESGSVLTYWRQGRCPSYGDGVTFWALAEIIKSPRGVFETDGARNAEEKLERVTRLALADPTEAEWALRHRARSSASTPARRSRAIGAAKHSRPGVGCSRPLRSSIRSCSSSRTSNGRTTGCSISSRNSSGERAACR